MLRPRRWSLTFSIAALSALTASASIVVLMVFVLERQVESLRAYPHCDERVVDFVFGEVARFAEGAPPHDDMTVLSVNWF